MQVMRLYLINPSNPLVSIVKVKESRWNRFRVWKPHSLMVLADLTPPEWEIAIVDENLSTPNYEAMERVDAVVTEEAEGIWPQVLEDERNGRLKPRYDGGLAEISDVPIARHDLLAEDMPAGPLRPHAAVH
jgi:hypothetical protein